MSRKIKVCVVYGGKSCEHEVSRRSAAFVLRNINRSKFELKAVAIDKDGRFWRQSIDELWLDSSIDDAPLVRDENQSILHPRSFSPESFVAHLFYDPGEEQIDLSKCVVFPVLHGTHGEDGTFQGLCEMAGVGVVGSNCLGSAVCMDKWVSKRLVRDAGIQVSPYVYLRKEQWAHNEDMIFDRVSSLSSRSLIVKPSSLGSSVGMSKINKKNQNELKEALKLAFRYDRGVLIEEMIDGRELECAVLGTPTSPMTTWPSEIVVRDKNSFYTYEAKYQNKDMALLVEKADICESTSDLIRETSAKIFDILSMCGMARIDFFWCQNKQLLVFNEANTIPGFTQISQYPKMWAQAGVGGADLCQKLIDIAILQANESSQIESSYL